MFKLIKRNAIIYILLFSMFATLLASCSKSDETPLSNETETQENMSGDKTSGGDEPQSDGDSSQPEKKTLDIYLVAGQSNATGCTRITDMEMAYVWAPKLENGYSNVLYAGNSRSNGAEPRDRVIDWQKTTMGLGMSANHVGPEAGMAKALSAYYNEDSGNYAGIIKYAFGGSSLFNDTSGDTNKDGNWVSPSYQKTLNSSEVKSQTGQMYRNFLAQVERNIKEVLQQQGSMGEYGFEAVRICGLYWMQGCQNKSNPDKYEVAFTYFAMDIRNDLSAMMKKYTKSNDDCGASQMPIVVGTISQTQNLTSESVENVNKAFIAKQKSFANTIKNCYVVDNSAYAITKWENGSQVVVGSDQWHWNQRDMLEIGKNVGDAMLFCAGRSSTATPDKGDVIEIFYADQLFSLAEELNKNPLASKGKTYKLMVDININPAWSSFPTRRDGKFVLPSSVTEFSGINEFYGVFDGNGKTISGIYMSEAASVGGNVAIFKKLNGGTVKNLTVNTAFIFDCGGNGATVSGLVGTVSGDGAVIENVTVRSNVYSASNAETVVAGIVGKVSAQGLIMRNVTFGGYIGNVAEDLSINSPSTAAVLGQMIADGADKTVSMTECKANGGVHSNSGATVDPFCAKGAMGLIKTDCTEEASSESGIIDNVIEISTAEEFLALCQRGQTDTFEGRLIVLMNDIDLNIGWSATVTIDSHVNFPQVPQNVWTPIPVFKGTLDGNGHILSGLYVSNSVTGNAGAYGGLFNTLDGGTVTNIAIINSFILVENSDWANDLKVHVGGIAGDVNADSVLDTVYLDAEIWFKSWEGCVLGAAFGHANAQYTVKGYVFVGRIGNTDPYNNANYAITSKNIYITQLTGNQNGKEDKTITNCLIGGTIYSGKNSEDHAHLGLDFPWRLKFVLVGKQTSEWLGSRSDYSDAGFVYSADVESAVPGEVVGLINAVYSKQ